MFITRLIPITDQQFVFIDAESTSAVHHWTFKHSWWWANQPHAKQQEMEADLREFNDALQAALEANHEHRVQIAGAVVDGCVYAVPKGVRPGRFAEVAFGICNLVKGGLQFRFDVLHNHFEQGTRTVAEYIVGPRSWWGKDGLIWIFPFRSDYIEIEVDSLETKRLLQNPDTCVRLVKEVGEALRQNFTPRTYGASGLQKANGEDH